MLRRRQFLRRSLALTPLTLTSLLRAQDIRPWSDAKLQTISIFHSTDLHGHIEPTTNYEGVPNLGGLARCAAQFGEWRRQAPESLLLDIGDVYQGTELSHASRGQLMIELFNRIRYDSWTIGNHEFDWGHRVLLDAVQRSRMPVLGANFRIGSQRVGSAELANRPASTNPWANLQPRFVRQFGELKVGVFGVCTPALASWLPAELRGELEVMDPVKIAEEEIALLRNELGAHIVVCCAHMGLRGHAGIRDNLPNRIQGLLQLDGLDLVLGGHTHQNFPEVERKGTYYSQAAYWGIACGRVDLTWDHESRRVTKIECQTLQMDHTRPADPIVMDLAARQLGESQSRLATPIGELGQELSVRFDPANPGGVARLIGEAVAYEMQTNRTPVDAVFHGTFTETAEPEGPKTLADAWRIIPYENLIVTFRPTVEQLCGILNEGIANQRSLIGLGVIWQAGRSGRGASRKVQAVGITNSEGKPLAADQRVTIAVNAFDSQGAGGRLPLLARAVADESCQRHLHPVETRTAVIKLFTRMHPVVL